MERRPTLPVTEILAAERHERSWESAPVPGRWGHPSVADRGRGLGDLGMAGLNIGAPARLQRGGRALPPASASTPLGGGSGELPRTYSGCSTRADYRRLLELNTQDSDEDVLFRQEMNYPERGAGGFSGLLRAGAGESRGSPPVQQLDVSEYMTASEAGSERGRRRHRGYQGDRPSVGREDIGRSFDQQDREPAGCREEDPDPPADAGHQSGSGCPWADAVAGGPPLPPRHSASVPLPPRGPSAAPPPRRGESMQQPRWDRCDSPQRGYGGSLPRRPQADHWAGQAAPPVMGLGLEAIQGMTNAINAIANQVNRNSGRSGRNAGWPYFDGTFRDYPAFKRKFESFQTTYHRGTPTRELFQQFHEMCLPEKLSAKIKSANTMVNAWVRLEAWFGDKALFIKDLMQDIKSVTPIKEGDDERMMDYYVTLQAHIEEVRSAGALDMLLIPANVELMVLPLTTWEKRIWREAQGRLPAEDRSWYMDVFVNERLRYAINMVATSERHVLPKASQFHRSQRSQSSEGRGGRYSRPGSFGRNAKVMELCQLCYRHLRGRECWSKDKVPNCGVDGCQAAHHHLLHGALMEGRVMVMQGTGAREAKVFLCREDVRKPSARPLRLGRYGHFGDSCCRRDGGAGEKETGVCGHSRAGRPLHYG
jgi:hypothetical protein